MLELEHPRFLVTGRWRVERPAGAFGRLIDGFSMWYSSELDRTSSSISIWVLSRAQGWRSINIKLVTHGRRPTSILTAKRTWVIKALHPSVRRALISVNDSDNLLYS